VTSTKQFVWLGNRIAQERNASNVITRSYFAEGEERGSPGAKGTKQYYYSRDHLGSIREMTSSSGALQARYDYDPYGQRTKLTGALDVDFGYTGHYFHTPSGLNLTLHRAYNPALGRWLSRDPAGEDGGVNLYRYVQNNPVNAIDPLGLRDYSPQETRAIMDNARAAARSGPVSGLVQMLFNHGPYGIYDFQTNHPKSDTFSVGDRQLNPAQFGNFLAGYAGTSYGASGYLSMRAFGILIDALDGGPTYWDNDGSSDDINAGAIESLFDDLLSGIFRHHCP
jgi:RHS repeat-associated protein